jgi:hypothetical protein
MTKAGEDDEAVEEEEDAESAMKAHQTIRESIFAPLHPPNIPSQPV